MHTSVRARCDAPAARMQGFQLWINVPSDKKMDGASWSRRKRLRCRRNPPPDVRPHPPDPRYGTVPPSALPLAELSGGVRGRVLAGTVASAHGPFQTVQPLQMVR